ncbi:MAG: 2-polyprenyl-3-methyl-6-methoxy-1,4-benzoquinone monooxygenase [Gammaproteobacteria bacterium]|nr:2-polyprenyl-3-methyl-6-methoxy-1,4-benzoquinone monooxygenase [Gammaproteobacteria bacterium]
MEPRTHSLLDRLLGEIDKAIRTLAAPQGTGRRIPATTEADPGIDQSERLESQRLMRVNHAGEVAAQALYQGQALTARDPQVAAAMHKAAVEEGDHLAWCRERIGELGGRTSALDPLWYAGSFAIGAAAGALGDRISLGFIAETERQVEAHLRDHLDRLPATDQRSRAILEQMRHDEITHGRMAEAMGGAALPLPVRVGMRLVSRLMTNGSYWL